MPRYSRKAKRVLHGLKSPLGRQALRLNTAATLMPTQFLREVRPDLVVDVGANRGQFLLDVRDAAPLARVIAFEPLSTEFEILRRIHVRNPLNDLRQCGIGRTISVGTMHVSAAADSSSLLPISPEQARVFPGTHEVAQITVKISTLDAELHDARIPASSILKIDVQGGELDVLAGASGVLARFGYVLVELSFVELYTGQPLAGQICDFMIERAFQVERVLSLSVVDDRPIQADFVFRNCARVQA